MSQQLPRVLFTQPLKHLSIESYKDKFSIEVLKAKSPQDGFIQHVNQFQPNAIFFTFNSNAAVNQKDFFSRLSKEAIQQLQVISNLGVGYDRIDAKSCTDNKIYASNTPDVVADATADVTLSLILSCARKASFFERSLRKGEWNSGGNIYGFDLKGKTLGIVGCGSIGKLVIKRARAFGMEIVYHKRNRLDQEEEKDLGLDENSYYSDLNSMLGVSDIVTIHTPLNSETRHLISTKELEHMKPGSYLINTSRGPVVDEAALVQAIRSEHLAGCGLDVYENEPQVTPDLLTFDNVVLYPHIGTQTKDTRIVMETLAMRNIESVLIDKKQPVTPVPEQKRITF
jgi:glyoxylate reductase